MHRAKRALYLAPLLFDTYISTGFDNVIPSFEYDITISNQSDMSKYYYIKMSIFIISANISAVFSFFLLFDGYFAYYSACGKVLFIIIYILLF